MSPSDPNAAAPAPQPAEVIATTDEIEKKRIELKSMLSGCIASGKLQVIKLKRDWNRFRGHLGTKHLSGNRERPWLRES